MAWSLPAARRRGRAGLRPDHVYNRDSQPTATVDEIPSEPGFDQNTGWLESVEHPTHSCARADEVIECRAHLSQRGSLHVAGTFETCQRALDMSAWRGRLEVTGRRSKRRF